MEHNLCKGRRFFNQYYCVTTLDHYWYDELTDRWGRFEDHDPPHSLQSSYRCKSIRAFRRKLKKWSKTLPAGVRFVLSVDFSYRRRGRRVTPEVIGVSRANG